MPAPVCLYLETPVTNAYCTIEDVKASMAGDAPNMGAGRDQAMADRILEVSRDLDRCVTECRGDPVELWSFLADQAYGSQIIYLSSSPAPSGGTFVLAFNGEITGDMDWNVSAADVQATLENLTTIGAGNVVVTGFDGGPFTVAFAADLSGPQALITGRATLNVVDAKVVVLGVSQGVSAVPSERVFRSSPDAYGPRLLVINDCIEIESVAVTDTEGDETVWDLGDDFVYYPSSGLPIEALKSLTEDWPEFPGFVTVNARWGYAASIPADVKGVTIIEVVRSIMAAQAGNDDRIGVSPFGRVMTAKAYTSKFYQTAKDYGSKLW